MVLHRIKERHEMPLESETYPRFSEDFRNQGAQVPIEFAVSVFRR
jgi:hypothetical protein